ncbi:MAG: type II CAAX endopeptidase family protein [Chitinophagaceae bacterium]
MEQDAGSSKICTNCIQLIPESSPFCTFCGQRQDNGEDLREEERRARWLRLLTIFYMADLVVCTVANFNNQFTGLYWLLITESVLAVLTLVFMLIVWKEVKPLFQWKSFSLPKVLVYMIAAILFGIAVNVLVKWLNRSIFDQEVYYYRSFRHLPYPKFSMVMLIAILPAIFEELAYRGIILQGLFKLVLERQAILIAAFLFAIIHMSLISFFWLLPFAIWLGNVRLKENTIWYGVLIHFFFNLTACIFEFWEFRNV